MIPLPSNHVTRRRAARQFDNLVLEEKLVLRLQDIVLQLHLSTKSTRKRGDVTPAVLRPRKRRKGGVFATDRLSSWPRNWRCLEELSAMLADAQGRGGRPGQDFHCTNMEPLLDRTAHSLIRKPSEILREEPFCQPDPSNSLPPLSFSIAGMSTSASSPGQPLSF